MSSMMIYIWNLPLILVFIVQKLAVSEQKRVPTIQPIFITGVYV